MQAPFEHSVVIDPNAHARRNAPITLSDQDARVLARFSEEVRTAAVSCAALLSCFNAVGFSKALRLPHNIAEFAPHHLQSLPALARSPLSSLLSPATRAGLKGFALFLAHGREELERVLALHQRTGAVHKAEVAGASDVMSTAACFAKITLKDLVVIHGRLFHDFDVAQMNYLAGLLDDVLQGKCPLLSDGKLVPVRTDFHIRERRVEFNAEALVVNTHRVERVMVCNISQGGLGFEGPGHFEMGQLIEIKLLATGRRLDGRLSWRVGSRAGVAFARQLEATDSLLA